MRKKHYFNGLILGLLLGLIFIIVMISKSNNRWHREYLNLKSDMELIMEDLALANGESSIRNLEELIGKYHIEGAGKLQDSTVFHVLEECGAWYPDVIMAQYIIESGRGTSRLARTNNNLFGMRCAVRRPSTQLSSSGSWGLYLNWEHSIIDRVLWDHWVFKNRKPDYSVYLSKIASIYAEAPEYLDRLETTARAIRSTDQYKRYIQEQ